MISQNVKNIKYAVASGHYLTNEVAQNILANGGNAFDAAVAAFFAMTITEPAMCSSFAGGFANIYTKENGNKLIDFFAQTPISQKGIIPNYDEIVVDFGLSQEIFYAGPASMSVTGAMAMVHYFVSHHCRMELKELVQPAQKLAKEGVKLTNFQALDLQLLKGIFALEETGKEIFNEGDNLKVEGDLIQMPAYADFLESFARENKDWVYRGEVAKSVVDHCKENGGFLRMADFEKYELRISKPFAFDLDDYTISVPGLPSLGGGLVYLFSKKLWSKNYPVKSENYFKQIIQAFDYCTPYIKDGVKLFDLINNSGENESTDIFAGGTSHFNILDKWGNAISMSVSIGEGSGYFIPDTHIQMNNMLGETALMPNGLNSWQTNKRLSSMMCPVLVFDKNVQLALLTGTGGATRIPFSISQLLYNRLKLKMSLDESIHAPRIFKNDKVCYLEKGLSYNQDLVDMEIKIWDNPELLFGGVHTIDVLSREAIGDRRREGCAVIVNT